MHALFMPRCLELAERGRGRVSPNPLVGCVLVQNGRIIDEGWPAGRPVPRSSKSEVGSPVILGEGWHEKFGGKHAECVALEKAGELARGATLYVNLEPCCHHGKTPPCTDAIIAAGIKTVVFGARDPLHGSAKVLKEHGIEVTGPVLEAECRHLNRGFFSIAEQGRPWVTLKKAVPRECVALLRGRCVVNIPRVPRLKITSEEQDRWTHTRLRTTHDAILVGSGTVLADDPQLNVRHFPPARPTETHFQYTNILKANPARPIPQPRRVILDPRNEVPTTSKVLTDEDSTQTLVIREKLPIPALLESLKAEGITSVLVEGGPSVWKSFEESGCVDEVVILTGK